ncbi:MAG: metallophosphatase family protein [Bacteroidia bacterium]|nr:metallophosphatase family protein [Bacteroidia bacterium]
MKIALFSDVHGNIPALMAVLEDMKKQHVDQIYCLGDLVSYAPFPNEVVEEIRRRYIPTIAGNHDEAIGFDPEDDGIRYKISEGMKSGAVSRFLTNQLISTENRAYLKGLPRHMHIEFRHGEEQINLLLVHGSPRRINEYLFEAHDEKDLVELMRSRNAHIMAFGHTHKPFHRILNDGKGTFLHAINTGSVGKPKDGNPDACYVIVELGDDVSLLNPEGLRVEFIRVPYDIESVAKAIEEGQFPDEYADMLRKAY